MYMPLDTKLNSIGHQILKHGLSGITLLIETEDLSSLLLILTFSSSRILIMNIRIHTIRLIPVMKLIFNVILS